MNNRQPVELQGQRIKRRFSSGGLRRKIVLGLLATLIVCAMIAWLGFLGWGILEMLRSLATFIKRLVVTSL